MDIEVAAFQIGVKSLPDPCDAFPGKVEFIDGKHFIRDFVRFQNGKELNDDLKDLQKVKGGKFQRFMESMKDKRLELEMKLNK